MAAPHPWARRNPEPDMSKRPYNIEIAGQQLPLRSDEGEHYLQDLARSVQERIDRVFDRRRGPVPARAALLVAMELADELYREKDLHRRLRKDVEKRLSELDSALLAHEALLHRPANSQNLNDSRDLDGNT